MHKSMDEKDGSRYWDVDVSHNGISLRVKLNCFTGQTPTIKSWKVANLDYIGSWIFQTTNKIGELKTKELFGSIPEFYFQPADKLRQRVTDIYKEVYADSGELAKYLKQYTDILVQ